jgi:hypothetical protein
MGIKQNYLYRALPGLEQENKVSKQRPRLDASRRVTRPIMSGGSHAERPSRRDCVGRPATKINAAKVSPARTPANAA